MKLKAAFILISGILLNLSPALFAEEVLTITTYYPSPYGVYKELRFFPNTAHPETCTEEIEGTVYYNSSDATLYFCNGAEWTTNTASSEYWDISPDQADALYPLANRKVLVGPNTLTGLSALTVAGGGLGDGGGASIGYKDERADNGILYVARGATIGYIPSVEIPAVGHVPPPGGLLVKGQSGFGTVLPSTGAQMEVWAGYDTGIKITGAKYGVWSIGYVNGGNTIYGYDLSDSDGTGVYGYSRNGYGVIGDGEVYDFWSASGGEYGKDGNWCTGGTTPFACLWPVSDRNMKENFSPVDSQAILTKISQLPLTQWNFKEDAKKARHIGPVSQDFYALFGVSDEKHIAYQDASGVALAGIKALNQKIEAQGAEIKELNERIKGLEEKLQVKP